jgi:RNA 3'-terminal phosphate cyclase
MSYIEQIKGYTRCGYHITGILGIQSSPSCDLVRGVFMEELIKLFEENGILLDKRWFLPNNVNPIFDSKKH